MSDSGELNEPFIRWGPNLQRDGAILGLYGLLKELLVTGTPVYGAKNRNGISATATADCNATDWPMSH